MQHYLEYLALDPTKSSTAGRRQGINFTQSQWEGLAYPVQIPFIQYSIVLARICSAQTNKHSSKAFNNDTAAFAFLISSHACRLPFSMGPSLVFSYNIVPPSQGKAMSANWAPTLEKRPSSCKPRRCHTRGSVKLFDPGEGSLLRTTYDAGKADDHLRMNSLFPTMENFPRIMRIFNTHSLLITMKNKIINHTTMFFSFSSTSPSSCRPRPLHLPTRNPKLHRSLSTNSDSYLSSQPRHGS